ncbi:hypothetical protein MNEG_3197 [Monoraphidium neglectum]|uniref:Uncharacterized protein n=1 Tax=Monoraphidium neglectum TaxID=145388 RepID=A0A0D2LDH4_9CHLO|nr:hypothetical protein MNEG_3197 [Monoraphidium neglectum]KIZ04754.1 hypothetical protein MNEG_3197 [Monoraphidium neglectum]|eukprot:XP_013903773.1 hypothetical protein MNEG_3197 [Monoraphidium neglectum]
MQRQMVFANRGTAAARPNFAGARVCSRPAVAAAPRRAPRAAAITPVAMGRVQYQDLGRPQPSATWDDIAKEESRKYRRTVFNFDNWEGHRSVTRYNRHLIGMLS